MRGVTVALYLRRQGVIMGWFDAEFAKPVRDESRIIEGDVVNGEPELAFDDMGQPNPKIATIELKDKKGGVLGFDKVGTKSARARD